LFESATEVQIVPTGTVKWFNDQKGYGFIAPDSGEKDLFIHHSNIGGNGFKTLVEGAKVEFESREGAKGPEAFNVVPQS
jgi:cold shock protein